MKFLVKILTVQIMKAYWTILLFEIMWQNDSATFHRNVDNQNFHNQLETAHDEAITDENLYFGEDGQPEMFAPENIGDVEFHHFQTIKRKRQSLKRLWFVFWPRPNQICFFRLWFMHFLIYKKMKSLPTFYLLDILLDKVNF